MQPVLRPARMCDAKKIHGLLMECSAEGLLLPRSLSNLYGQIRDFRILETSGGEFIGCAALAVIWENLAEVRSLAIAKPWRGNGFGNILVDECCKDARRIGIDRVFALTYQVRFFERNGFGVVSKDLLPQRVWIVCANCPRFPDCDEVAVMRHLDAGGAICVSRYLPEGGIAAPPLRCEAGPLPFFVAESVVHRLRAAGRGR